MLGAGPLRTAVVTALACATMLLLTVALLRASPFAPRALYGAIDTLVAIVALAAAWLMRRRFLHTGCRCDLLLAVAVLAFFIIHVVTTAVPAALGGHPRGYFLATDIYGELLVDAVIAAAVFASGTPLLMAARRPNRLLAAMSLSIVGAAAVAGFILNRVLVDTSSALGAANGHILAIAVVVVAGGLPSIAAVGFARDAASRGDRARLLIAAGMVVMAAAPPLQLGRVIGDDYSLIADVLLGVGFGLIALAALRWELEARRVAARAAALAERRRVARDLHDGLAQDLAFIAAHGSRILTDVGAEHPVVTAAKRALQISRSTIAQLSDPNAATAHEALEAIAAELRKRFGIAITVDVDLRYELPAELQEHVDRIAREAIANAARHGHARTVAVSLRKTAGQVRLRIEDDGRGIDAVTGGRRPEGFGLRSIRERAAGVGGSIEIGQLGRRGTVLDVVLA
jgi:signal transduction histidine kinase